MVFALDSTSRPAIWARSSSRRVTVSFARASPAALHFISCVARSAMNRTDARSRRCSTYASNDSTGSSSDTRPVGQGIPGWELVGRDPVRGSIGPAQEGLHQLQRSLHVALDTRPHEA